MNPQVSFGQFRFEPATARLWQDQSEVKLTRKAAAVLRLLIEHAGRPVTKDELFASAWRNRVVSDDALVTCIQELRKALGDNTKQPLYIQTRHRSGYQFIASVSHTGAAEPYEYFLRGRQHLHRMQQPEMDRSRRMFERAIELDASYAPAWAGLATVHAQLFEWWGARDEDLRLADRASHEALRLAPHLADAHVARGYASSLLRQYSEAQYHFETAARINPHLFDAYYYFGRAAFAQGEVAHSADLFRQASEVRPEDCQSLVLMAQSLQFLGRNDEAIAASREGIARAECILALNPVDGRALAMGSQALYVVGETSRAMEWSRRSLEHHPDDMSALLNAACLRARAGLKEEALEILEDVFSRGWGKKDWIEQDPDYDSLRHDTRFKRLLARLK